jgi:AcrR family transcriptional regulator
MKAEAPRRAYRQGKRADETAATRQAILTAAAELLQTRWYDELTLRDVASEAGVAVQTVVNHFGTKPELLAAVAERMSDSINSRRDQASPEDPTRALDLLLSEYEEYGDGIVRMIALEERVAELAPLLAGGRAQHRAWIQRVFAPALEGCTRAERGRRTVALIAVTDVLAWKVVRREQGLGPKATREVMQMNALALLDRFGVGS